VCHASQILWLILAMHTVNSAVCGFHWGNKGPTAKRRLNHVCSEHTVYLWGYHRL
jgi:hypothetical protein